MKWQLESHDLVDSTNLRALDRVQALWKLGQAADGLVLSAVRQSAGRGQHGRAWQSPPGGLYFSAVIESPPLPGALRDKLALIAGVALAHALEPMTREKIQLRWPNDVLLAGKKVAGVLCESLAQGSQFACVIGIGVNVNTRLVDLPEPLRQRANSLAEVNRRTCDLAATQRGILAELAATLEIAGEKGLAPLVEEANRLDSLRGKVLDLEEGSRRFRGKAGGIAEHGELILQTPCGPLHVAAGTVLQIGGVSLRQPEG